MKFAPLFVLLSLLFSLGCASNAPQIPQPGVMPSGGSFDGVWYSPQFEEMYLRQSGDTVRGIYTYKRGGTLEGKIQGDMLMFTWIEPGEKSSASREFQGKGYFKLIEGESGARLEGAWGYNDEATNGGPWVAEYTRKIDNTDPKNLDELRANK